MCKNKSKKHLTTTNVGKTLANHQNHPNNSPNLYVIIVSMSNSSQFFLVVKMASFYPQNPGESMSQALNTSRTAVSARAGTAQCPGFRRAGELQGDT